jgi:hypothetical protein
MLRRWNIVFPTFLNSLATLPLLVLRELAIEALCTETTLNGTDRVHALGPHEVYELSLSYGRRSVD